MPASSFTLVELKQLIIDSLQLQGMTPEMIEDEQPLFGEGLGLDSVDALELVVALEKRLSIKIRSEEVDPKAFASASSLFGFIETRMAGAGSPSG